MLLQTHLRFKHLPNNSASSPGEGVLLMCQGVEESIYAWSFCTALCFVLGFPTSVVILWEMFKALRRRSPFTPHDFFILNLSTMDVVFLAFIPPGLLNSFTFKSRLFEKTWNSIYALNTCGRPLLMACVCLDCYLAVVHPIIYHRTKSLAPRVVMAGVVWTLTVASGTANFISHDIYFSLFPVVPFIIAIVIIGICDSFIVYTLVKSDHGTKNIHPQKQRAIHTLIYSLVITVLSYLIPVVVFVVGQPLINNRNTFLCTVAIPLNITSPLGSAVFPMLYLYSVRKLNCFRLGLCRS